MVDEALRVCSREQIHVPGNIQNHGILLIVDEQLHVVHCSTNVQHYFGVSSADLLGKHVSILNSGFGRDTESTFIRDLLDLANRNGIFKPVNPYTVLIAGSPYNLIISQSEDYYLLDLEPEASDLFEDPQNSVGARLSEMLADRNLQHILNNSVQQIKHVIGYDRVMIYQFHDDGHGQVVAEEKNESLESWLGLHYPASDIPQQARELYKINLTRLIANIHAPVVAIASSVDQAADLTHSTVRAASPVHLRYLENMGVHSSFSVSVMIDGALWGLVACHNYTARFINYQQRETAKLIGQVLSSCIGLRQQEKEQNEKHKLQRVSVAIARNLLERDRISSLMESTESDVLEAYNAVGLAFVFEGEVHSFGTVPDDEILRTIAAGGVKFDERGVFCTTNMELEAPSVSLPKHIFAGMLGCQLTQDLKDCLLLFRSEQASTVTWAGDPNKLVQMDDAGLPFISPRNSFEEWREQVRGFSKAWTTAEIDNFIQIRDEINVTVSRKTNELRILNEKLREAYAELDSFAYTVSHDLKTPLTAIKAFAELIRRKSAADSDVHMMSEKIAGNADRLNDMIQTVLGYAKIGQISVDKQPVDMAALLGDIREQLLVDDQNSRLLLQIDGTPEIQGDPVLLFQVFLNVIENAVKYSQKVANPEVSVVGAVEDNRIVYRIKDNGVGIATEQQSKIFGLFSRAGVESEFDGSGIGLATVKKILIRHGAEISVESELGQGSTFMLRFP